MTFFSISYILPHSVRDSLLLYRDLPNLMTKAQWSCNPQLPVVDHFCNYDNPFANNGYGCCKCRTTWGKIII